jgi:phage-related protein
MLKSFPAAVQKKLGFALYQAQIGQRHENAKLLHGFETAVWQVRADDLSGTYRAVYIVTLLDADMFSTRFRKRQSRGSERPGEISR